METCQTPERKNMDAIPSVKKDLYATVLIHPSQNTLPSGTGTDPFSVSIHSPLSNKNSL